MGEIYTCFKQLKKQSPKNWFMDKMGLVKFELNGKNYEIFFPRKRANKYSAEHFLDPRIKKTENRTDNF